MAPLDRKASERLDRIRTVLGLNETELASLFGMQRQSVADWREKGIPQSRRASVERLEDLARVLAREIIESRIPEIVRTPDDWLGGKSMLAVLKSEGTEPIYGYLHRLFTC